MVELRLAEEKDLDALEAYRNEFQLHHETIHGSAGLDVIENLDTWLAKNRRNRFAVSVEEGFVSAKTFLAYDGTELVGMIDIRESLNDFLMHAGGHIGYSVRPSKRRQGYALDMLDKALRYCASIGLERVLITCEDQNTASQKTIEHYQHELENIIQYEDIKLRRYWLKTKQ